MNIGVDVLLGLVAGIIFFGGLRWTTIKVVTSRYPSVFVIGSFFIRTILTLSLLFITTQHSLIDLLIAISSFTLVRLILVMYEKTMITKKKGGTLNDHLSR